MSKYSQFHFRIVAWAWLGGLLFSGTARAGDIVAVVDENGRKIYINAGTPAPRDLQVTPKSRLASLQTGAPFPASPEITDLVERTANRLQVDPRLVHAIIKVESEYNPKAVSPKGAMGLMQLIPETARRFGVENPFNPEANIAGGVSYLKYLLDLFGGDVPLSLAAYNAGENAVQRSGGIPAFRETQDYVQKVTSLYQSAPAPLFGTDSGEKKPSLSPICRYVDQQGVVHYTNVE